MSALMRTIIVIIEFLILAVYEFFHIRKEINNRKNPEKFRKYEYILQIKEYKLFASIFYPILNLIFICLFLFMFPNHIFLCYKKLFLLGGIVLLLISSSLLGVCIIEMRNKVVTTVCLFFLYILLFACVGIIPMTILNNSFDFPKVLNVKEDIKEISDIHNIIKLNQKSSMYVINFKNTNKKSKIIYEYETSNVEFSNTTILYETTITTTKYSSELKDADKYSESETSYILFIDKNILTDLTNKH